MRSRYSGVLILTSSPKGSVLDFARFLCLPYFNGFNTGQQACCCIPLRFLAQPESARSDAKPRHFVDFLAEAGMKNWQVCPLGPTGFGDSPYQCFSAFAGNPYFIDLETLVGQGLLEERDLADLQAASGGSSRLRRSMDTSMADTQKSLPRFHFGRSSDRQK